MKKKMWTQALMASGGARAEDKPDCWGYWLESLD